MHFFFKLNNTALLSFILMVLNFTLALAYYLAYSNGLAAVIFLLIGLFYLFPFLLSQGPRRKLASLILSFFAPLSILAITIVYKQYSTPDPINYFDSRIMLVVSAIIPLTCFNYTDLRLLIFSLFPSFLCLTLYDPIHQLFSVGYFQLGLPSPDYYFSANTYSLLSYSVFVIGLLRYKQIQQSASIEVNHKNYTLNSYLDTLLEISRSSDISSGKVISAYKVIAKATQQCLQISRVSIWQYDEEQDRLVCMHMCAPNTPTTELPILKASEYPTYFNSIKKAGLIIAPHAHQHPLTQEFHEAYLLPNNICSMMDAMFNIDGKLAGIICCEEVGRVKDWHIEDSIFLRAVSDFICLVHNINCRKQREAELKESNRQITTLNELLEDRVKDRTLELERKNKQLAEYAFINSHMLRGPIARVAGLANIIQTTPLEQLNEEYLEHLQSSIIELEEITQKINTAIDVFGEVSREKLAKNLSLKQKKEG